MEIHKIISQTTLRDGTPTMQVAILVERQIKKGVIVQVSVTRHLRKMGRSWFGWQPYAYDPKKEYPTWDYTEGVNKALKS